MMPEEPVFPPSAAPGPAAVPPPPPPPVPPGPPMGPAGATGAAASTTTGLEPNVAAGLAVLFSFISGIVFLAIEKRSQFVRFWAMQSVVVGGGLFAFHIASWILGIILAHIPFVGWVAALLLAILGLVVSVLSLILYVIMLIKAFTGVEWEVPVVGKFARQQLAKLPV